MKFRYIISAALIGILCSCTPAPQPQPQGQDQKEEQEQKPDAKPEPGQITVITGDAIGITKTEATLSGSYENVTTQLREHGFYWGTSESALTHTVDLEENDAEADVFEAKLSGLEPETTYYFQAYVTVKDQSTEEYVDIKGAVKSFTTSSSTTPPDDQDINNVVVTTMTATGVSNTAATLNGSYSGVTMELRDHGFYWGTSKSALSETIGLNSGTAETDIFEATISSLESGTTYYFKAYVTVWDKVQEKYVDVEGDVMSFTTSGGSTPPNPEGGLQYLGCYEIPAISLLDNSAASNNGTERVGSSKWYNYLTTDSDQMVVTHTYKDGGKVIRNWTALVDKNKKASMWNAFVMHRDVYTDHNVGRYGSWREDPGIPADWQSCFSSSGYSRGHQVASNYRQASTEANSQTFYYTNQALQYQNSFNDGVWNNLENAVVANAPSGRDTLYVVVGLLYEDGKTISGVPCPSHFYKCLMKCSFSASGEMTGAKGCAYIYTNEPHSGMSYSQGITTIDAMEQRSGFDFYANVPAQFQDAAESSSSPIW